MVVWKDVECIGLLTVSYIDDSRTGGKGADGDEDRVTGLVGDEDAVVAVMDQHMI